MCVLLYGKVSEELVAVMMMMMKETERQGRDRRLTCSADLDGDLNRFHGATEELVPLLVGHLRGGGRAGGQQEKPRRHEHEKYCAMGYYSHGGRTPWTKLFLWFI